MRCIVAFECLSTGVTQKADEHWLASAFCQIGNWFLLFPGPKLRSHLPCKFSTKYAIKSVKKKIFLKTHKKKKIESMTLHQLHFIVIFLYFNDFFTV